MLKTRKRQNNTEDYRRNVIKKLKLKGQEYTGHGGKQHRARSTRSPSRCKKNCFIKFTGPEKAIIFDFLYADKQSKDEQDLHLQRMIEVTNVNKHRPRIHDTSLRVRSFKYHVLCREAKVEVCREAFFKLYDVTDKRIKRIRKLLLEGKSPHDMRGRHPSSNKIGTNELLNIHEHISSFPVYKTHYATNANFTYLSSELSVKEMYALYKVKYPRTNIKYEFYNKYFNENFDLKFGKPQIDTCCFCEEKKVRIRSPHINDTVKRVATAELMVHMRRAKQFTSALRDTTQKSKENDNILGLVFDFMQNISLPKIPVQDIFYLRQLSVNVFCIFNSKTDSAHYYIYHEGQGRKGPNEVASLLLDYIKNQVPESITELHLFSDNCPGQNKNHTLSRVCLALTDTCRFKKITHFFPLRGHSYNPCDRKFSVIKRPIRKCDRIYTPHQVCEIIANAEKKHPGTITPVTTDMITDFSTWWPTYYKKTSISMETTHHLRNEKEQFNISKYHYFEYSHERKGVVRTNTYIKSDGVQCENTFLLKKGNDVSFPSGKAYSLGKIPIKQNKVEDLKKIMPYILDEHKAFFHQLLEWPVYPNDSD